MKEVKAMMPAKVISINVQVGDQVAEGQTLAYVEAMKMEMAIESTASGSVAEICIAVGDSITTDDLLFVIN